MNNFKIYALTDSSMKIRYIGLTSKDVDYRLKQHLCDFRHNNHKINWIKKYGNSIKAVVIENGIKTIAEAKSKEVQYIKAYKQNGYDLINATDGGDFCFNKGKPSKNKGIYKVSNDIINKLKDDYATKLYSQKDLSLKYNISKSSIDRYLKLKQIDK
jgi:predicted GIY-YIG superfamily endonuclease